MFQAKINAIKLRQGNRASSQSVFHNRGEKSIISTSASEKSISDEFLISMLKINNNEMCEYSVVGNADPY